jgi:hypothetical protein
MTLGNWLQILSSVLIVICIGMLYLRVRRIEKIVEQFRKD